VLSPLQPRLSAIPGFPIKLVLLLQDLEFGGSQRYAINLLKNLDPAKFLVSIWVLRGGKDMAPLLEEYFDRVSWLSNACWVNPVSLVNLAYRLTKSRPDILYTLTIVPNIWGRLLGAAMRVPFIVTSWRSLFPKQHERWMWPLSTHIIANSAVLRDLHVRRYGVDIDRTSVIHSGVDPIFFQPANAEKALEPTVLFVGRLVKEKDPFTLLEAFKITVEKIPNARLIILGNGKLHERLLTFLKRYRLESKIFIIPGEKDIRPLLRKAWLFAMTSVQEAFPNAILEAMASGLPVIATRVGGIPEMVVDGVTGFLCEPRDVRGLSEAFTKLLLNERQRLSMGQMGRLRVESKFSLKNMVLEIERVLLETVSNSSRNI
jgi:glycosyltransferase involved in cell wall biosynthesis